MDIISHQLLRKYIAYARQYVHPVLSQDAAAVIKEYYLKLRVKHRTVDSTPVTTRQLESLLRLTQVLVIVLKNIGPSSSKLTGLDH